MSLKKILKKHYRLYKHKGFLSDSSFQLARNKREDIIALSHRISEEVKSPHTQYEVLEFIKTILSLQDQEGVIVEAGCYKGSSTAKFSYAANIANKKLLVFDSFKGLPDTDEAHDKNIFGGPANFYEGAYTGSLAEVKGNVEKYGSIDNCEFIEGWFDDTMPGFDKPVLAAYVDVDLVSSTRTCIKHLYPLLVPGGKLYSQDGHLPLIIELLDDDSFWENEVGCKKPHIEGLRKEKLVGIVKE